MSVNSDSTARYRPIAPARDGGHPVRVGNVIAPAPGMRTCTESNGSRFAGHPIFVPACADGPARVHASGVIRTERTTPRHAGASCVLPCASMPLCRSGGLPIRGREPRRRCRMDAEADSRSRCWTRCACRSLRWRRISHQSVWRSLQTATGSSARCRRSRRQRRSRHAVDRCAAVSARETGGSAQAAAIAPPGRASPIPNPGPTTPNPPAFPPPTHSADRGCAPVR